MGEGVVASGSLPRKSLAGNDLRRNLSGDFGEIPLDEFRDLAVKRMGAED